MKYLPILCALLIAGPAQSATRYVDPLHPKSSNSGAGSATAPYKTISHALRQLVSGDRLVIAAGTYRESLNPKYQAQNLVIEGTAGTIIKGSDLVTGWEPNGGGVFVRKGWNVNSQQVFVNGVSYQQIGGTLASGFYHPKVNVWPGRVAGSRSSMTPNSFYYDAGARALYVKPADGSLSGKTVEVSVRERLGIGNGLQNIEFKNLSFMHSNTSATTRGGAAVYNGNRLTFDNISVTRADSTGLAVNGDYNTVSNSVFNYNGQCGLFARGRYVKLINNETSYNNTRGFSQYWEAGGAKFMGAGGSSPSGLMDSVISGHKAMYNNGDGVWWDTNPGGGNKITNSIVAYNQGYGIHFEISSGIQIYDNLVYGNKLRGIYIANGSNALVAHNLSANNGWEGIIVANGRRASSSYHPEWLPRNNQVIGNIISWSGGDALRLGDRALNNKANGNLYVDDRLSTYKQERNGTSALGATGLPQWKNVSSQDGGSWEKVMSAGARATAVSAMGAGQPNVDWSLLQNAASGLRAPATVVGSGLPPGPLSYNTGRTTKASGNGATPQPEPVASPQPSTTDPVAGAPDDTESPNKKPKRAATKGKNGGKGGRAKNRGVASAPTGSVFGIAVPTPTSNATGRAKNRGVASAPTGSVFGIAVPTPTSNATVFGVSVSN
jgi:parallel beta-helix repeat protein